MLNGQVQGCLLSFLPASYSFLAVLLVVGTEGGEKIWDQ